MESCALGSPTPAACASAGAQEQGEDADVGADDRDGSGVHRGDDPPEMLIHAFGHVIEARADLTPKLRELVAKGLQRAVGSIRAMLEHRRSRWHVGGVVAGRRA